MSDWDIACDFAHTFHIFLIPHGDFSRLCLPSHFVVKHPALVLAMYFGKPTFHALLKGLFY